MTLKPLPKLEANTIKNILTEVLPWDHYMPGNFEIIEDLLKYLPAERLFDKYYKMLKNIDLALVEDAITNKKAWEIKMMNNLCGECQNTFAYEISQVITLDDLELMKQDLAA